MISPKSWKTSTSRPSELDTDFAEPWDKTGEANPTSTVGAPRLWSKYSKQTQFSLPLATFMWRVLPGIVTVSNPFILYARTLRRCAPRTSTGGTGLVRLRAICQFFDSSPLIGFSNLNFSDTNKGRPEGSFLSFGTRATAYLRDSQPQPPQSTPQSLSPEGCDCPYHNRVKLSPTPCNTGPRIHFSLNLHY